MDSVMSGRSERSERSHHSHHHHHSHHQHHHYPRHERHSRERRTRHEEPRDDRSVTIRSPGPEDMAEPPDDRFEVQIIPQDDTWADNTTAVTGNTSETGFSMEDLHNITGKDTLPGGCSRWLSAIIGGILAVVALLSPVVMALLPRLGVVSLKETEDGDTCTAPCVGGLLGLAFRVLFLAVASWAVFLRLPRASLPRLDLSHALALFVIFLLCFSFWLFYGVSLLGGSTPTAEYTDVVDFASSLADSLLFTHLTLLVLASRSQNPELVIRVLRSPDGETRSYHVGALSVQRAAVHLLQRYLTDFPAYNAWLENAQRRRQNSGIPNFKVYDVDGGGGGGPSAPRAVLAASARRRDASHNQRFYEEVEYERRLRKRRARLLLAADEAFTHVRRLSEEQGPSIPMNPQEAAQAIFPSMARALQKYLRVTRQQPRYTMEAILAHLASCLSCDLSARAFLQRYLVQEPTIHNTKEYRRSQTWTLVCSQQLNRSLTHDSSFLLRQGDVTLSCTCRRLPHLSIREELLSEDKFVLRLSSETSV